MLTPSSSNVSILAYVAHGLSGGDDAVFPAGIQDSYGEAAVGPWFYDGAGRGVEVLLCWELFVAVEDISLGPSGWGPDVDCADAVLRESWFSSRRGP